MPLLGIEARVTKLEEVVKRLRSKIESGGLPPVPWWERIAGTFADDPAHEEAMKLGRSYRMSLRPGKPKARKR
jgi:hypothetical protein